MVTGKRIISKTQKFIKEDIWNTSPEQHSPGRYFLIRQVKIFFIAFREFFDKKIQMRASALTYYTLLSVVPVVAMVFGIAKGFGLEQRLEAEITSHLKGQQEVVTWIISFARNLLQNANGGVIAGVGLIVLFWSVMSVLSNIERSFNDIWQIKQARPFVRKFTDYLSIMLLAPVIIILSSSVTVFLSVQVQSLTETSPLLQKLNSLVQFLFQLTPYVLVWFLFTLIYIVMPNTRVRFSSALIAGILAGTVFQIVQWGYIHFQIGVNRYSAIYGGFAALPLFLIWLQLSWLIILFGAEISFANQNVEKYEFESESLHISHFYRRILTLYIVHFVVKKFIIGDPPPTAQDIAHELKMPVRIAHEIIYELVTCRIFNETVTPSIKVFGYQPARDVNSLTIAWVVRTIEKRGIDNISVADSRELKRITSIQESFLKAIENAPENILIRDI